MYIHDSSLARAADKAQITLGTSALTLMERAAEGLYAAAESRGSVFDKRIAVFCGDGNNGGDGFAVARLLLAQHADLRCLFVGERENMSMQTAQNEQRFVEAGGRVDEFDPSDRDTMDFCRRADIIIDAMYGLGFRRGLSGRALEAARLINWSPAMVIAADLPSGAEADTALVDSACVRADITVAFACYKAAHFIQPAKSYCGTVKLCDIGISMEVSKKYAPTVRLTDGDYLKNTLSCRIADSHKGDYGKVLIIGGSTGMTGAPLFAARAAMRTGSGLVHLAAPECEYTTLAVKCDEAMCLPVASTGGGYSFKALDALLERASACDTVVLGCGMGRSKDSDKLVCELLAQTNKPVVLDADGINAVCENINILRERKAPTVVTPHDVEFARLGGDIAKNGRLPEARRIAALLGVTVVLKGNTTVTVSPDGSAYVNTSGNPGMATGGCGDVLAGMIGALLGMGYDAQSSAASAVYLHGLAGDLAAAELGEAGMLASDVLAAVPHTLKFLNSREY